MELHFTYKKPDLTKLKQGDILKRTPKLVTLLQEIHPHYAKDEYRYFQVLTQTCDLVRRNGKCKSRYISIAAARNLDSIVERELCEKFKENISFDDRLFCSDSNKQKLKDFVNKLLHNNDTNHFFLQAQPDYDLTEDCCTQLHLSISIRAYEHFDVCLDAKILELDENFRAKLGWLVGNLYSRVGTEDYFPKVISDKDLYEKHIEYILNKRVVLIPANNFAKFKSFALKSNSIEEIYQKIDQQHEKTKKSRMDGIVAAIAKPLNFNDEQKGQLRNILNQLPILQKILG